MTQVLLPVEKMFCCFYFGRHISWFLVSSFISAVAFMFTVCTLLCMFMFEFDGWFSLLTNLNSEHTLIHLLSFISTSTSSPGCFHMSIKHSSCSHSTPFSLQLSIFCFGPFPPCKPAVDILFQLPSPVFSICQLHLQSFLKSVYCVWVYFC